MLIGLIGFCLAAAEGWFRWLGLAPVVTDVAVWTLPAKGYGAILIGSLFAVLLHRQRSYAALYRLLGARGMPVAAFAFLLLVMQVLPNELTGWPNVVMHFTMALCLVTIVLREDHSLAGVLSWRPIARIGEISYGIYLYHLIGRHVGVEIVGHLGLDAAIEPWVITVVFVPVSILMAEVSFRTVERYFLSFKSRPAGKRPASRAGRPGFAARISGEKTDTPPIRASQKSENI